ncbi:MAG: PqqD family protein [Thermoanaerobaculia bacterium]
MDAARLARLRSFLTSTAMSAVTLNDGTSFLVDPGRSKVARFNETAAFVVEELKRGASTQEELVSGVVSVFDVSPEEARREIGELLTTLEAGFLDPSGS